MEIRGGILNAANISLWFTFQEWIRTLEIQMKQMCNVQGVETDSTALDLTVMVSELREGSNLD